MRYSKIGDEILYYKNRYELERSIEDMFLEQGYTHIELPIFEEGDGDRTNNKRIDQEFIVKAVSGFSDILSLRYDNTTSIIKNIIPRWEKDMRLKLFYNSMVFRNDPRSGANEIKQLGIEYLGDSSLQAEVEITLLALDILEKLDTKFILEISNSKYIRGLFQDMKIYSAQEYIIKDYIYRKNKFGLIEYIKKVSLDKDIKECLLNIFELQGNIECIKDKAETYYMNDTMREALNELIVLKNNILDNGYREKVYFDLSMVMEMDYYDGIIFKGYYPDTFKAIISGGRYDEFTVDFGEKVAALGFSLDVGGLTEVALRRENK